MGCDGSDVYVYEHCDGGIVCQWCSLVSGIGNIKEDTANGMIDHLQLHRSRGDTVPESTFEQLRESGL